MVRREHHHEVGGGTGAAVRLCVAVVALVIAVAALILAILAFIRPMEENSDEKQFIMEHGMLVGGGGDGGHGSGHGGHGGGHGGHNGGDADGGYPPGLPPGGNVLTGKTWLFAASAENRPYTFVNDEKTLDGFLVDVITEVCQQAGRSCQFTVMPDTYCWEEGGMSSQSFPGQGLLNHWFDACAGWVSTARRHLSLSFSPALADANLAYLYVPSAALDTFDPTDVSGRRIGVVRGYYQDVECLNQQEGRISGLPVVPANTVLLDTRDDAITALINGTIDAVFGDFSKYNSLRKAGIGIQCHINGPAVMYPKDSQLPSWFNDALTSFMASKRFESLCDSSGRKYGGDYAKCTFPKDDSGSE